MIERTDLYRAFDEFGRLLYVGISWSGLVRLTTHRARATWWPTVKRVEITAYASRPLAKQAETEAIKSEKPIWNVAEDGRTEEERTEDRSFWPLLVYLEPGLKQLRPSALSPDPLHWGPLDAWASDLVGWDRGKRDLRIGDPEAEPRALNEGLAQVLDFMEDHVREPVLDGEVLLSSSMTWEFVRAYLRRLVGDGDPYEPIDEEGDW